MVGDVSDAEATRLPGARHGRTARLAAMLPGPQVCTAPWCFRHSAASYRSFPRRALNGLDGDAEVTRCAGSVAVAAAQPVQDEARTRREGQLRVNLDDEARRQAGPRET